MRIPNPCATLAGGVIDNLTANVLFKLIEAAIDPEPAPRSFLSHSGLKSVFTHGLRRVSPRRGSSG